MAESQGSKRILAGIMGIIFGWLGVHKFILGYTSEGVIMAVFSVLGFLLSCFIIPAILPFAFWVIGVIEGIIYLTKSDAEFEQTYVVNQKKWF